MEANCDTQGLVVGPEVASALKKKFPSGQVGIQGVKYPAGITTNISKVGADSKGIAVMKEILEGTASKCPKTLIVASGYR
jgi:Cutinase